MGEEIWYFKWYDVKEVSMEGIVIIVGLKFEIMYVVRLVVFNGKGLGEISVVFEFKM